MRYFQWVCALGVVCWALLVPVPAVAELQSVVVYPDRASITRVISLEFEPGPGQIEIEDLPAGILRDSLRISAGPNQGLQLGSFEFSTRRGIDRVNPQARRLSEQIQQLKDDQAAVDDRMRARDMQLAVLNSLSNQSDRDGSLSIEQLEQALRVVGDSADQILSERRQLDQQKRELSSRIQRLERELADLGQQQRDTTGLTIQYAANTSGDAELQLDYIVMQASWRPTYEWRLDTDTRQLEMIQSAIIRQNTGEDWSDVSLSVSLAQPSTGGRLPELRTWWIGVAEPPTSKASRAMEQAEMAADFSAVQVTGSGVNPAGQFAAELAGTEYTRQYTINGRSSVAANNQEQRFRLAQQVMQVDLSARAVPKQQPRAWLYVEGEFSGEAPMPPGQLTLFQDNRIVGQRFFEGIRPGASLAASFGVDQLIEIDVQLIEEQRASAGVIRRSTEELLKHQIRIHNRHTQPLLLTVLDRMPVSTDERIQVELTRDTTRPDQRDVDDQPGVLAWSMELDADQQETLIVGYSVSYPEDIQGLSGW